MKLSVTYVEKNNELVTFRMGIVLFPNHVNRDIQSQCFYNVDIGLDNINMTRIIVGRLLKSPVDSTEGITLTADMPYQKKACVNITRPAVLSTYYGLTGKPVSATQVHRITYGSTSLSGSLSMDPRAFSTNEMYIPM